MLASLIYGSIIGILNGFIWGRVLSIDLLLIGSIVGLVVGLLVGLIGKMAMTGSKNIRSGEAKFVNFSILTVLALITTGLGLVVLLLKMFL